MTGLGSVVVLAEPLPAAPGGVAVDQPEAGAGVDTLTKVATYLRGDRNLSPQAASALEKLIDVAYHQLANGEK